MQIKSLRIESCCNWAIADIASIDQAGSLLLFQCKKSDVHNALPLLAFAPGSWRPSIQLLLSMAPLFVLGVGKEKLLSEKVNNEKKRGRLITKKMPERIDVSPEEHDEKGEEHE